MSSTGGATRIGTPGRTHQPGRRQDDEDYQPEQPEQSALRVRPVSV